MHHEGYAPLSTLLPRCAALVHHGGIGTLAQALAAGVPQLTMPMGFDQPDNTTRLLRLGVARWVAPSKFTGERVAPLLDNLLNDPTVAAACAKYASAAQDRIGAPAHARPPRGPEVRLKPDTTAVVVSA